MKEKQELINNVSDLEIEFWGKFHKNGYCLEVSGYGESGHPRFLGWTYGDQRRFEKEWNEDGFSLYFIDESGSGLIDWLWKNNDILTNDYLKNNYPNRKIYLITDVVKPSIIEFRLMDIPIGDLLAMEDGDKSFYGESIFDLEYEYHLIFDDALDQFNYEQSGAKMRSPEETREYLSDMEVLIPLFDAIREYLKDTLVSYDLSDGEYMFWCGRDRDCDHGEDNYFNNFKKFCRDHNQDWQVTLEALEQMTDESFFCECEMVNRFEGIPERNVEEHWKSSEVREPAS